MTKGLVWNKWHYDYICGLTAFQISHFMLRIALANFQIMNRAH